jgi:peroxiredoxin
LRQDYTQFKKYNAEILAIGPDGPNAFRRYWTENDMPFIGMADIRSCVADQYYQEVNLLKMGRMPALFIIDRQGVIRYAHYGDNMADIPTNESVLSLLEKLEREQVDIT